jgi:hypothetical protein
MNSKQSPETVTKTGEEEPLHLYATPRIGAAEQNIKEYNRT